MIIATHDKTTITAVPIRTTGRLSRKPGPLPDHNPIASVWPPSSESDKTTIAELRTAAASSSPEGSCKS